MESISETAVLVNRAHWLIKLRWVATVCVAGGTFFSSSVLAVSLRQEPLYFIAGLLAVYNTAMLGMLNHYSKESDGSSFGTIKRLINIQIFADLLILTVLLHFAGAIDNPFVFYYAFHMIIASILLSEKESYIHATLAIVFFGLLLFLEFTGFLPHYCLHGFVEHCRSQDGPYVLGMFFVFASALYLMVYMASYVATKLKQTEHALLETNKLLCEKDRVKDEYVLRVTHDMKGHLSAIQGCLDVVTRKLLGPLKEQQEDFILRAYDRTRKLTHFVKALFKLTQMRLGNTLEMEPFSLNNTINAALKMVEIKARDKSIELHSHIELSEDTLYGNPVSIEEAITNLLINAVEYTAKNGKVEINVKNEDGRVLVEVVDTGIGIPKEELPKVFDEFYRATNAKKLEADGAGLGLSITKQIIERHSGKIWVESEEGVGTKFSVTLPKEAGRSVH